MKQAEWVTRAKAAAIVVIGALPREAELGSTGGPAARRLAARVFVRIASGGSRPARGTRRLGPGRGDGDLDLDRTLDRLSGSWPPPPADLVTRTWQARRRALCLLIDTSGSMSGLAVAIAAVAASAVMLAAAGRHDAGVIAFSSEVSELHPPGSGRPPGRQPAW